MPIMAVLDINEHLEVLGRMGRFQWSVLFQTGFTVIAFAWSMFAVVFTHFTPPFR